MKSKFHAAGKQLRIVLGTILLLLFYLLAIQCMDNNHTGQAKLNSIKAGVQDPLKKAALVELEKIYRQAGYHQGSLLEIAVIIAGAEKNISQLPEIAGLVATFGYHTVPLVTIARAAASARQEWPQFLELARLAVLKLSETEPVAELAVRAAGLSREDELALLTEQISRLQATADFRTLEEARAAEAARLKELEERIKQL